MPISVTRPIGSGRGCVRKTERMVVPVEIGPEEIDYLLVAQLISNIRFEHARQIDELTERHKKRLEALHVDLSKARLELRRVTDQYEAKMAGLRHELGEARELIKRERAINADQARKLKGLRQVEDWLTTKIAEAAA